jgi:hypothetical protein
MNTNKNPNSPNEISQGSKNIFSKFSRSYQQISIKYSPKYTQKYELSGLDLGQFFAGCLTLWIMASSVVFLIDGKNPVIARAESNQIIDQQLLPSVKFTKVAASRSAVLGASNKILPNQPNQAKLDQNIKSSVLPNPYLDFPETAKLYLQNPELVLALEHKIGDYIEKYRAFEGLNSKYEVPVGSIIFLETSLKYQVPLSYTLSVARLESRFGTDCFSDANITRICKHKNIYSMGLDDSGNNKTYNSWEDGVYGFGAWYKRRITQGYTTCQIWRRYNPNGDYCSKVLDVSKDVEDFFKA